jgi:hypothetical protein
MNPIIEWEKRVVPARGKRNWFVYPLAGSSIYEQIPSQEAMLEHNKALKKSIGHLKTVDIIMAKPLIWAPCSLLSEWIAEGKKLKSFVTLKKDDGQALAYFTMWHSTITEMAKVGMRALFLFDPIRIPSVL